MFEGTFRYNIKYMNNNATEKEIDDALEMAHAKEVVYDKKKNNGDDELEEIVVKVKKSEEGLER